MLRTEHGTEAWHAVTEKYPTRRRAQNIVDALWLQTRIEESEDDPDE